MPEPRDGVEVALRSMVGHAFVVTHGLATEPELYGSEMLREMLAYSARTSAAIRRRPASEITAEALRSLADLRDVAAAVLMARTEPAGGPC